MLVFGYLVIWFTALLGLLFYFNCVNILKQLYIFNTKILFIINLNNI